MPVPVLVSDLSTTAASNSPAGTESPVDGDNYIRVLSAFIAAQRDQLNGTTPTTALTITTLTFTTANGTTLNLSGNAVVGGNVSCVDLTTTGSTVLGNASTDIFNAGNGNILTHSSGVVGLGVAPLAGVRLMAHTGANRNVALFDQASVATIGGVTDAGSSTALRIAANGLMFSGNGSTDQLFLTSDGRLYGIALHNSAGAMTGATNQYIGSGTYTPTGTGITNVSSIIFNKAQWVRIGNVVTVYGSLSVVFTTATLASAFEASLPIASNLAAAVDLNGTATADSVALSGARLIDTVLAIKAMAATDRASFTLISCEATGGTRTYTYQFAYEVL